MLPSNRLQTMRLVPSVVAYLTKPPEQALEKYLAVAEETEAESLLTSLLGPATIRQIDKSARHFLGTEADCAEEIRQDVLLALCEKLRRLRRNAGAGCIDNWLGYVAQVTRHRCYDYLQRKNPQWQNLRERVRYRLAQSPDLALWSVASGQMFCGLVVWQGQTPEPISRGLWYNLTENITAFAHHTGRELSATSLRAIFSHVGGPVALNELVSFLARQESVGVTFVSLEDEQKTETGATAESLACPDVAPNPARDAEQRDYLRCVWQEVQSLPLNQRKALLLNFREELDLFPLLGIATFRDLAAALEMPASTLAAMWSKLPLDDASLVKLLSLRERQQVINLRQSAWARLRRRLRPR